uniref:Uncharacterized protein n=1 Tax=Anguilla anguilla TaxID=7936 RepID=A0A0E9TSD3_ANGAN
MLSAQTHARLRFGWRDRFWTQPKPNSQWALAMLVFYMSHITFLRYRLHDNLKLLVPFSSESNSKVL